MARIVGTDDFIFSAAADSLYRFSLPSFQNEHINTEEISNKIPKVKKPPKESELENEQEDSTNNIEYQIVCMSVSRCKKLLAVGTSHKTVLVFTIVDLQCFRSFCIPKAPTTIVFDGDSEFMIIGDRAGHVRRYTVTNNSDNGGRKDITGELCYYEGEPLMGAISMVLDIAISPNNKLLAIADRDEKIRIHRYPKAYVIEAFALGHSNYVSSVYFHGAKLFSAGGDSTVKEWSTNTGEEISSVNFGNRPIKKLIISERDGIIRAVACFEGSETLVVKNLNVDGEQTKCISCSSVILDICQCEDKIYGVCRDGLVNFNLDDSSSQNCKAPNDFCSQLMTVKEPISSYFKNVTHQNMEDYQQRKREKMSREKEKKRKRKNSNKDDRDAKKLSDS